MEKRRKKRQLNRYIQLTGVAFQMGITIYLGAYFGKWLDAHFQTSNKIFTIIGTLFAMVVSIWSVLIQLKKINDKYE